VTVERIVTEEKREYASVDRYVAGETQIIETETQVVVQLPQLAPASTEVVVMFDPDGPNEERVLARLDVALPNTGESPRVNQLARSATRVTFPRSALKGQVGLLTVRMLLPTGSKVNVTAKLGPARSYANCRSLWAAYPGGIGRSLSSRDSRIINGKTSRGSLVASMKRRKPLVNLTAYRLNTNLDVDRDGIACERD
jgi:hypothetical protein